MTPKTEYEIRVTRCHVLPKGEPLFSEMAATVEIVDEAGGEYVLVKQQSTRPDSGEQTIAIERDEWPPLRDTIDRMIAECRKETP